MTKSQARELRALLWSWLPEGDGLSEEPTTAEQCERALQLLEQVREATEALESWTERLIRVASAHGASNPAIGDALGVGKERVRRRLLKEPGQMAPMGVDEPPAPVGLSRNFE